VFFAGNSISAANNEAINYRTAIFDTQFIFHAHQICISIFSLKSGSY